MDLQYLFDNENLKKNSEAESMVSFLESQKKLIVICAENGNNNVVKVIKEMRYCITNK